VSGVGDILAGRYRLLEKLGGGGMGVVFRARDEQADRDVAIKVVAVTSPEVARRVRREARASEGLDPERVAQVYELGETPDGEPFLVMEYVEGRTLRELLRGGDVARAEALRIVHEIATTLGEAHRRGLVHRDVKPDNVIVRGDGRVVLLDFGIVKHLDPGEATTHVTTQLTVDGAMIGTPAYFAPEQALGRDVGPAVDQFALGVTAFELLTGKLPWRATEVTRMLAELLAATPPPASELRPELPKPFDAVLARALSKAPEARFATVEAFAEALEAAERGDALASPMARTLGEGRPPTPRLRRPRRVPGSWSRTGCRSRAPSSPSTAHPRSRRGWAPQRRCSRASGPSGTWADPTSGCSSLPRCSTRPCSRAKTCRTSTTTPRCARARSTW